MTNTLSKPQQEHLCTLARLVRLLDCKRYITIDEIATRMGCTYAGAAKRLEALETRGCLLQNTQIYTGTVGAPPRRYRLHRNRASRKILDAAKRLT